MPVIMLVPRPTPVRFLTPVLIPLLLLAPLLWTEACAREIPDAAVTDLWDAPHNLRTIASRESTLFFICDLGVVECREGAVFFESRASSIRDAGMRPAFLFKGKPSEIRTIVLRLELDTQVYIDESGDVIEGLLDPAILPSILLVTPGGIAAEAQGGGESLADNIERFLVAQAGPHEEPVPPPEKKHHPSWKYIATVAAIAGAVILALLIAD